MPVTQQEGAAREFSHPSFREYYAACEIISRLQKWPTEKFQTWFNKHKNDLSYLNVWRFVSGLIPSEAMADRWLSLLLDIRVDHKSLEPAIRENPWLNKSSIRNKVADYIDSHWGKEFSKTPPMIIELFKLFSLETHPHATSWKMGLEAELEEKKREELNRLKRLTRGAVYYGPAKSSNRDKSAILLKQLFSSTPSSASTSTLETALTQPVIPAEPKAQEQEASKPETMLGPKMPEPIMHMPLPAAELKIPQSQEDYSQYIKALLAFCMPHLPSYKAAYNAALRTAYGVDTKQFDSILAEHMASNKNEDIKHALIIITELGLKTAEVIAYAAEKAQAITQPYHLVALRYFTSLKLPELKDFVMSQMAEDEINSEFIKAAIRYWFELNFDIPELISLIHGLAKKNIEIALFVSMMNALSDRKIEDPSLNQLLADKLLSEDKKVRLDHLSKLNEAIKANVLKLMPKEEVSDSDRVYRRTINRFRAGYWGSTQYQATSHTSTDQHQAIALIKAIARYKLSDDIFIETLGAHLCNPEPIIQQEAFHTVLRVGLTDQEIKNIFTFMILKSNIPLLKTLLQFIRTDVKTRALLVETLITLNSEDKRKIVDMILESYLKDSVIKAFFVEFLAASSPKYRERILEKLFSMYLKPGKIITALDFYESYAKCIPEALTVEEFILANISGIIQALSIKTDKLSVQADSSIIITLDTKSYILHPEPDEQKKIIESIKKRDPLFSLREIMGLNPFPTVSPAEGKSRSTGPAASKTAIALTPSHSATVFHPAKRPALGFDPWYDDSKINTLLEHYCQNAGIVSLETLPFDTGNDIEMQLIQDRLLENFAADKKRYFLPLRINSNHWIGLYIDRQSGNPLIYWLDPYANALSNEFKDKFASILQGINFFDQTITAEHIQEQTEQLQYDGVNCGPWTIEILRCLLTHGRLPAKGEIDIAAKKAEHEQALAVSTKAVVESEMAID
jgi:hypothetical protein